MNILHFDSEAAWVAGTSTFWRERLRAKPSLRQCLAGGNTPIPLFGELARATQDNSVTFKHAVIFALDEFGGLPPEDPGKCRSMLLRDLVNQVDLPPRGFHFLNPDAPDLDAECRAYDAAIGRGFDLVLLGIGTNGHLGMNEPGSTEDSLTRRVELHESTISRSARYLTHNRLPRWGLTVGMKQFFDSKEVWMVATGEAKSAIVHALVKGPITEEVPASLLRRHPNCSLFIDHAAGAQL